MIIEKFKLNNQLQLIHKYKSTLPDIIKALCSILTTRDYLTDTHCIVRHFKAT